MRGWIYSVIFVITLSLGMTTHARADFVYSGNTVDFLENSTLVHDPDASLKFEDIVASYLDPQNPTIGQSTSTQIAQYGGTYWMITKVSNAASSNAAAFSWSGRTIEQVDLWVIAEGGTRHLSGGRLRPPRDTTIPGADEFLTIDLPFGETVYLVSRFESFSYDGFQVTLNKLNTFERTQKFLGIFAILLLGVIAGLGLYHAFIALAVKDTTYGYYAGYTLGSFFVWSSQLSVTWFWIADGALTHSIHMTATFLASGFGVLFSMSFLDLKTNSEKWYRCGIALVVAWFLAVGLVFSQLSNGLIHRVFEVLLLLSLVHIFVTCYIAFRGGSRYAKYYVISASAFLSALAYWLLESKGFAPEIRGWQHIVFAGTTFQMVTLAAGLAARINWLERDVEYAKEADRAKSQFLATMSHEIRTPMNSVLGFAGLLLDSKLSVAQRDYAKTIKNSGESLLSILNDVLDLTKIESGALELEETEFSLLEVVDSVVDLMGAHAYGKGIEFAAYIAPDVPVALKGDPGRLRQVLLNLVNNAVKFTDRGGITIEVTLSDKSTDRCCVKFVVTDTGIGVSREKADDLFNRFTQADASTTRKYGGTGLGLAICKQIVDLMGGEIDVIGEPGVGSQFWFALTFERASDADRVSLDRCRETCGGRNVLVVDDSDVNRSIFRLQLEAVKADVSLASSAQEALVRAQQAIQQGRPFDVAIVDHMMPEEDGASLAVALRQSLAEATPKLILSSSSGLMTKENATEFGFDALLPKPVRQEALYRQIARLLGTHVEEKSDVISETQMETSADSGVRILLAEDNTANQMLFVAMLTRAGHSVDIAANGLEAIEALRNRPYDIVLMDVHMPEMGGVEATHRIRNMSGDVSKIPIIALTANAMKGDRERFIQGGMNDYVAKPVDAASLFEKIDWWTGGASQTPDAAPIEKTLADTTETPEDTDELDEFLRDLEAG